MPLPAETDILIAGAGPSGLTLANTLAHHGIPSLLVDRLTTPQTTSRAAAIHARTLEVLNPLGVTDKLIAAGRTIPSVAMHERDRTLLQIPFTTLRSDYKFILALPQDQTEAILTERLCQSGGTVERGNEILALVREGNRTTAGLRDSTGATLTVRARYVIGADGYHSTVRQACGIGFNPGTYAESFILGDVRMDWPWDSQTMRLFLSADGMVLMVPFTGNRFRIVATVGEAPEQPSLQDLQAILDQRGPRASPARVQEVIWSSRFRVHHGVAARYRDGRVFLVGDAAHVHSPAGGQGMNTGIQDAIALGNRLAAVISGRQPETHLDSYETERRPVAEKVVAMTDQMTRMGTLTSPAGRAVRNFGLRTIGHLPALKRMVATRLAGLDTPLPWTEPASSA